MSYISFQLYAHGRGEGGGGGLHSSRTSRTKEIYLEQHITSDFN
uniref:Uncharacterized protein n=1 Tax=Anguilla anguilla TaxID=7936 RepID=A0A0E9RN27_ANGAN